MWKYSVDLIITLSVTVGHLAFNGLWLLYHFNDVCALAQPLPCILACCTYSFTTLLPVASLCKFSGCTNDEFVHSWEAGYNVISPIPLENQLAWHYSPVCFEDKLKSSVKDLSVLTLRSSGIATVISGTIDYKNGLLNTPHRHVVNNTVACPTWVLSASAMIWAPVTSSIASSEKALTGVSANDTHLLQVNLDNKV